MKIEFAPNFDHPNRTFHKEDEGKTFTTFRRRETVEVMKPRVKNDDEKTVSTQRQEK